MNLLKTAKNNVDQTTKIALEYFHEINGHLGVLISKIAL